jgi:hypothetical protein
MPLINLVIALVVVGVLLWLINTYIPMDGKIKQILNVVVVIAVVIWLLQVFGARRHPHRLRPELGKLAPLKMRRLQPTRTTTLPKCAPLSR